MVYIGVPLFCLKVLRRLGFRESAVLPNYCQGFEPGKGITERCNYRAMYRGNLGIHGVI